MTADLVPNPSSSSGPVDVSDRAGRLVGIVTIPAGVGIAGTVDVSDRAGRLVGAVTVPAGVDVTDRAARALGVIASITAPVDVSDRAGRLVGVVDTELPAAAVLTDVNVNPTTPLIGSALLLWDSAAGQWTRHKNAKSTGDGNTGQGAGVVVPHLLNGSGTFDQARGDATKGATVTPAPAKGQTILSAAATTATLTLPTPGAGLFLYISSIRIVRVATAALAGTALLAYTTTQLNSLAWSAGNAMVAGGTSIDVDEHYTAPLKSDTAATPVTIVAPSAGAGVSVRISATFLIGP